MPATLVLEDEGVSPVLSTGSIRLSPLVPGTVRLQRRIASSLKGHTVRGIGPADTLNQPVLRLRDTGVEDAQSAVGLDDSRAGPDGLVVEGRSIGAHQGISHEFPAARIVRDGVPHGGSEVSPLRVVQSTRRPQEEEVVVIAVITASDQPDGETSLPHPLTAVPASDATKDLWKMTNTMRTGKVMRVP